MGSALIQTRITYSYFMPVSLAVTRLRLLGKRGTPSTLLWPGMAAVVLAAAWVLPNHTPPWRMFHQDAWMLFCALCLGIWTVWKCTDHHTWSWPAIAVVACSALPLLQWQAGVLPTFGQAIVSGGYILGFGLTMVMAEQIQRTHGRLLLHCLFAAIALGCIANIGLQLMQWFALYDENLLSFVGFLVTPVNINTRPAGSLLQPNQLATLLVWGFVAGFWAYLHGAVRPWVLLLYLAFLGLGLAITQSRIGLIELFSLWIATVYWRRLLPNQRIISYTLLAVLGVIALYFYLPTLSTLLRLEYMGRGVEDLAQRGTRLTAYGIFLDALLVHPWWGYGVSNLVNAYLELAQTQVAQSEFFGQTHNLVLDLLLWFGIPLGTIMLLGMGAWMLYTLKRITHIEHATLLMVVLVFGMHAMVEFPHQVAYLLIPVGVVIGALNFALPVGRGLQLSRWVLAAFILGGFAVLGTALYDYLQAEEHYTEWRFEQERIGKPLGHAVPEMIVLTQLEYLMQLQRLQPRPGLSPANMRWLHSAVRVEASQSAYFAYIGFMALNRQRDEAVLWMYKLNEFATATGLKAIRKKWATLQNTYPQIADLPWAERASLQH
jgi:Virulence factor membrane-bound polymerase, C-terminal/O-Antigen ligase